MGVGFVCHILYCSNECMIFIFKASNVLLDVTYGFRVVISKKILE